MCSLSRRVSVNDETQCLAVNDETQCLAVNDETQCLAVNVVSMSGCE